MNEPPKQPGWRLESSGAKRLFIVSLAALAAREESGSTEPAKCLDLANKFGAGSDFEYFLRQRTDPGRLIRGMNDARLLAAINDARQYEDPMAELLITAAKARKLEIPDKPDKPNRPIRKFSFDD